MYKLILIMVLVGGAVETYEKDVYEKEVIESYEWQELEKDIKDLENLNSLDCQDFVLTLPGEDMVQTSTEVPV